MSSDARQPRQPRTRLGRWLEADRIYTARLRLSEKPGPLRRLAAFLAHSGDSWFWVPGLAIAWLVSGQAVKLLAAELIAAIALMALVVFAIKRRVRRERPKGEWGGLYRRADPHSVPSGHAARMALLAVLAVGLGPAWFAVLLLVWAPLVALARVALGVHFLSDVIVGAALGIVLGLALLVVFRLTFS